MCRSLLRDPCYCGLASQTPWGAVGGLLRLMTAQKQDSSDSPRWPPKGQTHPPQTPVTHLRQMGTGLHHGTSPSQVAEYECRAKYCETDHGLDFSATWANKSSLFEFKLVSLGFCPWQLKEN